MNDSDDTKALPTCCACHKPITGRPWMGHGSDVFCSFNCKWERYASPAMRADERRRQEIVRLREENARLQAIVDAIDELRDHEVSSVTIHHANPDFHVPDQLIEVYGWWTDEGPRRVEGESLIDCLTKALAMKRAAEAAKEAS